MRYAIYFTPPPDDPLTIAAASWLGRDAFSGEARSQPAFDAIPPAEMAFNTASARRYGFHATLKAPFTLAAGETESSLTSALHAFAATAVPVVLPAVTLRQIDGFFALTPAARSGGLAALAGDIVTAFDRFRALLSEGDIARRNPEALKPAELTNLHRWGYPYVFDAFYFHMTLTGRLAGADAERFAAANRAHFGDLLERPLEIASIALFIESEPGAPFAVRAFSRLERAQERRTA